MSLHTAAPTAETLPPQLAAGAAAQPQPALRILLVEERVFNVGALRQALAECGYLLCGSVQRLADTLGAVAEQRPNVVMMDAQLERTRAGLAVADEIRTRFGIGVMFVTARSDVPAVN
ncbi:MAG TPA: response regulator [Alphaproteobacteria bacterium]|nr:response regulator [Alphaproteobacteria bacterium]